MMAPLSDSRGVVRYHIGAQVDVSGLVKDAAEMESLQKLLEIRARGEDPPVPEKPNPEKNDELRELSEMLNQGELSTIKRHGGKMHREVVEEDLESVSSHQPRLLLKDPDTLTPPIGSTNGRLGGIYQHVSARRTLRLAQVADEAIVSACETVSVAADSLRQPIAKIAGHSAVTVFEQDRWLTACPGRINHGIC
jgi:hypothetical protein